MKTVEIVVLDDRASGSSVNWCVEKTSHILCTSYNCEKGKNGGDEILFQLLEIDGR